MERKVHFDGSKRKRDKELDMRVTVEAERHEE
jgi:hypothetical protein